MLTGKRAGAGLAVMILAAAGVLPASALPAVGTQTRLIDLKFQARRSEAFAAIAIHPVGQLRLNNAPGFPKARVSTTNRLGLASNLPSKDEQVANAEGDVPAHPRPFCIVPTQTSAEHAAEPAAELAAERAEPAAERAESAEQLSTENKGVEPLQEGSEIDPETTMASTNELNLVEPLQEGSGGWTDVETYVQTTHGEFNGNGGGFVAPLGGGTSVDSAKELEGDEAFFATGDADARMEHQQHQHPPDWMRAFERFRPRTSGRKLLGMATASARSGGVVRRFLTKGLEKLHAHVADTATASVLIGCASLRFGSKAVLLLTLVAGGVRSAAAANTTTTRTVGTQTNTTSSIGGINSGWTCVPGDADCVSDDTDEATWTWFEVITDVLALTTVLRFLWFSAVWLGGTTTACVMWARTRRSRSRSRRSRSRRASVSPVIPTADAIAVAVAVAATATPVIAAPPTAAAASTASTASVTATPATAATTYTTASAVADTAGTAAPAGEEAAASATSTSADSAPVPVLRRARSYFERIVSNLTETAMVIGEAASNVGEAASNVGDAALELVVVVHPTPAAEAEAEAVGSPVAVSNTSVAATTTVAAASTVMAASRERAASTASATAAAPPTAVPNTTANDAAAVPAAAEREVAGSSAEPAAGAGAGVGRPPVLLRSLSYFDRMVSNLTEAVSAVSEAVSNVGDAASNLGNALDMV